MDGYEWQLIDIEAFGKGPVCPVYEVSSIYYSSVGEAVESAREYAERYWKDRENQGFEVIVWKQPDNTLAYRGRVREAGTRRLNETDVG